jgi:hydrogenase-4 component B
MDQETLLAGGFASLLLGALITLVLRGRGARAAISRIVALASILFAAGCFVGVAVPVLSESGRVLGPLRLWAPSFVKASVSIRVDALSAFFLLIISGLASVAAWYSVGYTRKIKGDVSGFYTPLLLFVFGMAGVVVVDDFFFFFVPWEFMALSSYFLVIFHKEKAENLSAGFKYFFVTHAGTLALFFGVTLLVTGSGSSFAFEDMARSLPALLAARPVLAHLALLLVLLGFLVKAGAYPFGMWWLPDAHPAAPSPVSALLSGVMIKLGLYGILRVFFSILPPGPWTLPWGLVIGAFGTVSLFVGTMVALLQNDSKRLLAYSSIGQVGYMLLGFGIGLGLAPTNPTLAMIGFIAGLFHLLNHACFKGLLFLNAGTFEFVTGERDLNRLGGLGRLVPVTAACTVVASLSIAGLPPFNGFSSKWLLYHASVWGSRGPCVPFLLFGVVAIFISAVTLAIFVKFLGATIWGSPGPAVVDIERHREGPWIGPSQAVLAVLCVGLGVYPQAGAWLCHSVASALAGPGAPAFGALFGSSQLVMEVRDQGAVVGLWSPLVVGTLLVAAFLVAVVIRRAGAAPRRAVAAWSCGSDVAAEQLRFRADGYYTPLNRFIRRALPALVISWRPQRWPIVTKVLNPDGWGYDPLVNNTLGLFGWLAKSRVGLPQVYPAWNLIGLVLSFLVLFALSW